MGPGVRSDGETPMSTVQHIYCSAIISKKMYDALTSYVFSISAAKGGVDEFVVYLEAAMDRDVVYGLS